MDQVPIIYVMAGCPFAGGVKVVCEHVTRLCERGHDAQIWHTGPAPDWFSRPVSTRAFSSTAKLGEALRATSPAVKVATFWVTASWVASNLHPEDRGYYLVQDLDGETYGGDPAGQSYTLGLTPITEGKWVTEQLHTRWHLKPVNVGIGIDHHVFYEQRVPRERYRVLVPYRTYSAGRPDLKGWPRAERVLRLLARAEVNASVVTFGKESAPRIPYMPHIHVQDPSDIHLRDLYSQSGVFLFPSVHEGFGLPALEAMACGLPVVCTNADGNMEFCKHNGSAVVAQDDQVLAHAIANIMAVPERAKDLRAGGLEMASCYAWPDVIDNLERAYHLTEETVSAATE